MKRPDDTGSVHPDGEGFAARMPRSMGRKRLGTFPTRERAETTLAAFLRSLADAPQWVSVGEWGAAWLEARVKAGSHKEGRDDQRRWKRAVVGSSIEHVPIGEVTSQDVRQWIDGMRKRDGSRPSASTARNNLSLLRCSLEAACYAGRLEANPALHIRLPKGRHAPVKAGKAWLTRAQVDVLLRDALTKAGMHRGSALVVLATTGIRCEEAWALRWDDLDLGGGWLRIENSKTPTSTRAVRLLPPALHALRMWDEDSRELHQRQIRGLVWPSKVGGEHARGYAAGYSLLGLPGTIGGLRGTCGSLLLTGAWVEYGWTTRRLTIEEVSRWLGHSSVGVTSDHYARIRDVEMAAQVTPRLAPESGATHRIRTGDLRFTKPRLRTEKPRETGKFGALLGPLRGHLQEAREAFEAEVQKGTDSAHVIRRATTLAHHARIVEAAIAALVEEDDTLAAEAKETTG